jgi:hypothetical protein
MLTALTVALFLAAPVDDDMLPANYLLNATPRTARAGSSADGGVLGLRSTSSMLGVDSLRNWSSYFYELGVGPNGVQFTWPYTMVGRSPFPSAGNEGEDNDGSERTTRINAPIVPVIVDLRNFDGSPRFVGGQPLISDPTRFVQPVLNSPVFSNSNFDSSERPTQVTDAIFRAQFFNHADDDFHTVLHPTVKNARTMVLIRGTYRFALNADGSCCRFVLVDANTFTNALFPPTFNLTDTSSVMGGAEVSGDITTRDMSTFLFPDTYLYIGNPSNCCILGFHSFDLETGDASNGFRERRFVMNYSSWITPGLFNGGFEDVTALSHEISETFNDPFVGNTTPWWLSPNGNCQNNLEDGDVIEGLPNGVFPITMNGMTYHPQNEALLEWFAGQTPSSAIHGAYSYPDTTVLTAAAVSQLPGCTAPGP